VSFRTIAGLDETLQNNFADILDAIQRDNWDWLHLNSGIERGGKSSFALFQAKLASENGLKFDWSPKLNHVFFYEKNLAKQMMNLPDRSVAIIDEGGEVLFSRRAIEKEVIEIIQTLMIYGSKNILLIINIPDWRWIDKYIRLARVRSLAKIRTYPYMKKGRMKRARGFYEMYTRAQVINASRGLGSHSEGYLGSPSFGGRAKFFGSYYEKEWDWYSKKKTEFLKKKKEKQAQKKRKQDFLAFKKLPKVAELPDDFAGVDDLQPIKVDKLDTINI